MIMDEPKLVEVSSKRRFLTPHAHLYLECSIRPTCDAEQEGPRIRVLFSCRIVRGALVAHGTQNQLHFRFPTSSS